MMTVRRQHVSALLQGLVLLYLLPVAALAQPDVLTERILFEPTAIPGPGEEGRVLYSFRASVLQAESAQAIEPGLSAADRRAIENDIAAYVTAIGDRESEEGPFSDQLTEDLFTAGRLARQLEDHDRAIDFLQRAQGVSRINYGLETLDQLPVMAVLADTYLDAGRLGEADRTREAMLELTRKAHGADSIEVAEALLEYGNWQLDAYLDRSSIVLNVERMNVAQFMQDPNNFINAQNSIRDTPLFHLYLGQHAFIDAISILVGQKAFTHPRLLDLERELLTSYMLSIHRENILYDPDFYLVRKQSKTGSRLNTKAINLRESDEYRLGETAHKRTLAYIAADPERTAVTVANAMLESADWHLLFERKVKGAKEYQAVYDLFVDLVDTNEALRAVLYPEFPVVLPVYLPGPNSREKLEIGPEEPVRFFGYYDVSFRMDKYGMTSKVRILGQGGEVTRNMEIRMLQYLQKVRFRPMFRDGKPYTDTINLRYYLGI